MRDFFSLSRRRQWLWAIVLLLLGMLPVMGVFALLGAAAPYATRGPLWLVGGAMGFLAGWLVLLLVSAPVIQLTTAPLLYLLGKLKYYSPMLLVENPSAKAYSIHGGTNFDYLVHLRWRDRGPVAARKTLRYYLQGLVALADEVERGVLPRDLRIVAASYIFTPSTARRLGFVLEEVSPLAVFGLYLNYLNLLWKHSFAQGRLAFPDLRKIRQAATTGGELLRHRDVVAGLLRRLERDEAALRGTLRAAASGAPGAGHGS